MNETVKYIHNNIGCVQNAATVIDESVSTKHNLDSTKMKNFQLKTLKLVINFGKRETYWN